MSDHTQSEKKLKTWDEAIKELGAFIRASKEQEKQQEKQRQEQESSIE